MPAILKRLQKVFMFSVEGIPSISESERIAIQKVTLPEQKVDVIEHAENGRLRRTEGIASVEGELVLEALIPITPTGQSNAFYNVARAVYNQQDGTRGVNPFVNITIREFDVSGTPTRVWRAVDCICTNYKHGDLDATGNENLMQTLTFTVNDLYMEL